MIDILFMGTMVQSKISRQLLDKHSLHPKQKNLHLTL